MVVCLKPSLCFYIDGCQGRNSQNYLGVFVRFFVTPGLKILRLKWLKVVFDADIIKGDINYCKNYKVPIFYEHLLGKSTLK